jgi:type I restriction enzyme S subunit
MMEKQIRIPQLRFPEFTENWVKHNLGEIASFSKGKGISKADIVEDGTTECIRYGELYTTYGETIDEVKSRTNIDADDLVFSTANDIIIPASGETQIDIATASCVLRDGIALGGDLNIVKTQNNGVFLSYYLNNKKKLEIASLAQGISVVHLYASQLSLLELNLPSKIEQDKIALFVRSVDKKIQALKKKESLLVEYKKGVMHKLFSQELRFKDDNGIDFPKWEEKKLSTIMVERNIQEPKGAKYPLMAFIAYKGVTPKGDRYNREFLVSDGENKKYKRTELGDFIYSSNNLETGSIGLNNYGSASISPVYSIFEIKEECNNTFIESYFTRKEFISKMIKFRQGVIYGQWRIHESAFLNIKEYIPSLAEQNKIAGFLSLIENKLDHTQTLIENMEIWKNGLMQKMFC